MTPARRPAAAPLAVAARVNALTTWIREVPPTGGRRVSATDRPQGDQSERAAAIAMTMHAASGTRVEVMEGVTVKRGRGRWAVPRGAGQ